VEPFTHELAQMTPEEFFTKIIVERMGAKSIVVGYDFTFGLHRQGTVKTLEHLCKNRGIGLVVVEPQFLDDTLISSTNIRKFVAAGDVGAAAKLLGRPYLIRGTIISGRGIGGKLHAHTANIETKNEIIPQNGVYITRTNIWENKEADPPNFASYDSITSIGDNPTFPEAGFSIETHLIAANVDVLEMTADILFIKHMRAQLAFDSTKLLAKQIQKDIDAARRYHLLHKDC
jgi:riboflavin kinase/FMN adenylyltransferase